MNAIDKDPTLEGILYEPARGNPFDNTTWVKNVISSGSIVPPQGEGANVRRSDYLTGLCVLCFIALGVAAFTLAMIWRH